MVTNQTLNRRRVVAIGAAALASPAIATRARAADYALKIGTSTPVSDPLNVRLAEVAERIKADSGGRIELSVFPASQLGGDNDLLSQARSGAIDFCQPTGQIMSSILPLAATSALGFIWTGYDQIWPAMDGDLGAYIRDQIAAKTGLVPMTRIWDLGFRQVTTSNRPIRTAEDLAGLKLRVPIAPSLLSLFTALKAAPVGIQFGDVYTALQTRVVDGQENPLSLITAAKFFEVQKYLSVTNHVWDGYWICCNARVWRGLPKDVQEIVARNLDAGALKERADVAELNGGLKAELTKRGMVVEMAAPDSFRQKLRDTGFYREWRTKLGDSAWTLLEKHVGPLG